MMKKTDILTIFDKLKLCHTSPDMKSSKDGPSLIFFFFSLGKVLVCRVPEMQHCAVTCNILSIRSMWYKYGFTSLFRFGWKSDITLPSPSSPIFQVAIYLIQYSKINSVSILPLNFFPFYSYNIFSKRHLLKVLKDFSYTSKI